VASATIFLVRHGETDWNRDGRVQGHTDVPLNDAGRVQARALAAELATASFEAVYSSDLGRAVETATILATPRSLEVTALAALREKHFGTWEGLTDVEVQERFPDAIRGHWGDAETTEDMTRRVLEAICRIADAHDGAAVLVVTHGGPMRALLRHCDVEDGPIANCDVVRLLSEEGVLRRGD
jgi:broad specificity phosphatase PhoE